MTSPAASTTGKAPELLSFAPMINCALSRLVLAHYGVAYREVPHLFLWTQILTLFHGGYGKVPLLWGPGLHLSGPHDMAVRFDPAQPAERRLLPDDAALRATVEADWTYYMAGLAGDVAKVCYFHLLPDRPLMTELFGRGLSPREAWALPRLFPLLRWLLRLLLGLKPENVEQALARVREKFDATDKRIADGRTFLAGGRLTLSDLSLAAAAGPLLQPLHYEAPVPRFEQMPPALQAIVTELRGRPTAVFVAALYARLAAAGRLPPAG